MGRRRERLGTAAASASRTDRRAGFFAALESVATHIAARPVKQASGHADNSVKQCHLSECRNIRAGVLGISRSGGQSRSRFHFDGLPAGDNRARWNRLLIDLVGVAHTSGIF